MQFAIIPHESAQDSARRTDPDSAGPDWAGGVAYSGTLVQAGVFVRGAGLDLPTSAAILRHGPAGRIVQDGPFAEVKEQLGGFFIIGVPDLDTALS
ncbi:MAG: YciI family protein [Gemmobacter sp.]